MFTNIYGIILSCVFCVAVSSVKNFNKVHNNLTLVHLFEWKWSDIALECETFLQHKGYGGVQISPPNEYIIADGHPWWERYQPVSYTIQSRSGNEDDFKNMTARCNNVGVGIFVDAVFNHMAGANGIGTAGNTSNFDQDLYPGVPYGPNDFHSPCEIQNYNDAGNVRNCQLGTLRDLNQGSQYVRGKIIEYLNHLIDLGVSGFRIDAAKHMWPEDLKYIYSKINNLNVDRGFEPNTRPFIYRYGEYTSLGHVTEFKYGNSISNVFKGNDKLTYLVNWGPKWNFMDSQYAVVFVDNHDTQRDSKALTYKNLKQYKMANAFMLAHPYGVTKIMSSYNFTTRGQGPPQDQQGNLVSPKINDDDTCGNGYICEHRWRQIYNMVLFRKIVQDSEIRNWWSNGDQQISFCRGNKGFVAFTNYGDLKQKLQTCLPSGQYCDIISGNLLNGQCTGKVISVDASGFAEINIVSSEMDGVLATHVNAKL